MYKNIYYIACLMISMLFFIGFVGNGYSFQIVEMEPSYGNVAYEYGYGLWESAYLETDTPYFQVDWFVNNVYQKTSMGDGEKTYAYFDPGTSVTGNLKGIKYTIKAVASAVGENADFFTDTDSYELMVYSPKSETEVHGEGGQQHLDVHGYIQYKENIHEFT